MSNAPLSQLMQKREELSLFNTLVRQLFNMQGFVNRFGYIQTGQLSEALWEKKVGNESEADDVLKTVSYLQ